MDVVPLLPVAKAQHDMGIQEPGQPGKLNDARQRELVISVNPPEPECVLIGNGQHVASGCFDGLRHKEVGGCRKAALAEPPKQVLHHAHEVAR